MMQAQAFSNMRINVPKLLIIGISNSTQVQRLNKIKPLLVRVTTRSVNKRVAFCFGFWLQHCCLSLRHSTFLPFPFKSHLFSPHSPCTWSINLIKCHLSKTPEQTIYPLFASVQNKPNLSPFLTLPRTRAPIYINEKSFSIKKGQTTIFSLNTKNNPFFFFRLSFLISFLFFSPP